MSVAIEKKSGVEEKNTECSIVLDIHVNAKKKTTKS